MSFTCRDHAAAVALIDAMVGWTAVGADSCGDEISQPTSPVVRAHLVAVLGDACMNHGHDTKPERREAMAAYLRSVADHLAGQDPKIAKLLAANDAASAQVVDHLNRIGNTVAGIRAARARGVTKRMNALLAVIERTLNPEACDA